MLLFWGLASSESFLIVSWGLLWSILGLEDDPPTLKNQAPAKAATRFLKNQRFRYEDGLESVLGLSCAPLGGLLGTLLGLQIDPKVLTRSGPFALCALLGSLRCSWGPPALFWGALGGLLGASKLSWDRFWCFWKPPRSYFHALPNDFELHNWLFRASMTYVCLLLLPLLLLLPALLFFTLCSSSSSSSSPCDS